MPPRGNRTTSPAAGSLPIRNGAEIVHQPDHSTRTGEPTPCQTEPVASVIPGHPDEPCAEAGSSDRRPHTAQNAA